jgi:hypothetical protein
LPLTIYLLNSFAFCGDVQKVYFVDSADNT